MKFAPGGREQNEITVFAHSETKQTRKGAVLRRHETDRADRSCIETPVHLARVQCGGTKNFKVLDYYAVILATGQV